MIDEELLNKDSKILIDFLKELSSEIKNNSVNEENLLKITEFYLYYKYGVNFRDTLEDEIMKYYCLGWYFYNNKKNN